MTHHKLAMRSASVPAGSRADWLPVQALEHSATSDAVQRVKKRGPGTGAREGDCVVPQVSRDHGFDTAPADRSRFLETVAPVQLQYWTKSRVHGAAGWQVHGSSQPSGPVQNCPCGQSALLVQSEPPLVGVEALTRGVGMGGRGPTVATKGGGASLISFSPIGSGSGESTSVVGAPPQENAHEMQLMKRNLPRRHGVGCTAPRGL